MDTIILRLLHFERWGEEGLFFNAWVGAVMIINLMSN